MPIAAVEFSVTIPSQYFVTCMPSDVGHYNKIPSSLPPPPLFLQMLCKASYEGSEVIDR